MGQPRSFAPGDAAALRGLHGEPHDTFGRIAALSPTVMWEGHRLLHEWRHHTRRWSRIYLDVGEDERLWEDGTEFDYGNAVRAFAHHLREVGYAPHELWLVSEPGAAHHERDWHRRLPAALSWLLG